MLECGRMTPVPSADSPYRVTLFFGPEPVEQRPNVVACVFNVKRRSWKAGIQVSVEVAKPQLSDLEQDVQISNRIAPALKTLEEADRQHAQDRVSDLFAQAVSWCKLDLRLNSGLTRDDQRIAADELMTELDEAVRDRQEYVVSYILSELDVLPDLSSPSSHSDS